MTFNELLKSAVGKHVKITMRGNITYLTMELLYNVIQVAFSK